MNDERKVSTYVTIGDILDFYCEVAFSDNTRLAFFPRWTPNDALTNIFDGLESIAMYDPSAQLISVTSEHFATNTAQGFWSKGISQAEVAAYWRDAVEFIHVEKDRIAQIPTSEPVTDYRTPRYHCVQLYRLLCVGNSQGHNIGEGLRVALKHEEIKTYTSRPTRIPERYATLINFYAPIELSKPSNAADQWIFTNEWVLERKMEPANQEQDILLYNDQGELEAAIITVRHAFIGSKRVFWSRGDVTKEHLAKYIKASNLEKGTAKSLAKLGFVREIDDTYLRKPL